MRVHGKAWSAGVGEVLVVGFLIGALLCAGITAVATVIRQHAALSITVGVLLLGCVVFVVQYRIRHRPRP